MVDVLGLDIGGANTKAALLHIENKTLETVKMTVEYFPIWKDPAQLANLLLTLKKGLSSDRLDGLGVTMTAELSDAYATKREGVQQILTSTKHAFPDIPIQVLSTDVELEPLDIAFKDPLSVAAANWAATGWLVALRVKDCVVLDVGSTSSSIIPIVNGRIVAKGRTDLEKLMCGELVYTGSLRTNVCAIVSSVPIRGGFAGVASELFALSGDVHLILSNIMAEQYSSETADGRGKGVAEASARLARVVCADAEMLTQQEIFDMAKYVCDKQIQQIAEGLSKVYLRTQALTSQKLSVVVTGLGKDFLGRQAAKKIGTEKIIDLNTLFPRDVTIATPAFAVALMAASKLQGDSLE